LRPCARRPEIAAQKAQALLGQMLIEGYGCEADPDKGREWAEKARRRGYRMQRVYCEI
jgi:TPR repeat protein